MKTVLITIAIVLCVVAALAIGAWTGKAEQARQDRQAQIAIAQLELQAEEERAEQAQAHARAVEAQARVDETRERYAGEASLTYAEGYVDQSQSAVDALILIATEDVRARDGRRNMVQLVIVTSIVGLLYFIGMAMMGQR